MEYQPKHLKQYEYYGGHCCFAGCTPMGCPGGCCVNDFGHHPHCPAGPWRQFDEQEHDIYVAHGRRKHLAAPESPLEGSLPALWPSAWLGTARRCGCGDVARYPNGCGPSGCQNGPA